MKAANSKIKKYKNHILKILLLNFWGSWQTVVSSLFCRSTFLFFKGRSMRTSTVAKNFWISLLRHWESLKVDCLYQCFSNHGSSRLCGWVAKACKLPPVKKKDLRTRFEKWKTFLRCHYEFKRKMKKIGIRFNVKTFFFFLFREH